MGDFGVYIWFLILVFGIAMLYFMGEDD